MRNSIQKEFKKAGLYFCKEVFIFFLASRKKFRNKILDIFPINSSEIMELEFIWKKTTKNTERTNANAHHCEDYISPNRPVSFQTRTGTFFEVGAILKTSDTLQRTWYNDILFQLQVLCQQNFSNVCFSITAWKALVIMFKITLPTSCATILILPLSALTKDDLWYWFLLKVNFRWIFH